MATDLPSSLIGYFAAQNDHDLDAMANAFAPDAEVKDEGRVHVGRAAIREWKRETSSRYDVTVEPLSAVRKHDEVTVVARVSGNFPGSPASLTYDFTLQADGLIGGLEIH